MALSKTCVLPVDPRKGCSKLDPAFRREPVDLSGTYFDSASEFPVQPNPSAKSQPFATIQSKTTCI
jgi:hypothetical protein